MTQPAGSMGCAKTCARAGAAPKGSAESVLRANKQARCQGSSVTYTHRVEKSRTMTDPSTANPQQQAAHIGAPVQELGSSHPHAYLTVQASSALQAVRAAKRASARICITLLPTMECSTRMQPFSNTHNRECHQAPCEDEKRTLTFCWSSIRRAHQVKTRLM